MDINPLLASSCVANPLVHSLSLCLASFHQRDDPPYPLLPCGPLALVFLSSGTSLVLPLSFPHRALILPSSSFILPSSFPHPSLILPSSCPDPSLIVAYTCSLHPAMGSLGSNPRLLLISLSPSLSLAPNSLQPTPGYGLIGLQTSSYLLISLSSSVSLAPKSLQPTPSYGLIGLESQLGRPG